MRSGCFFLLGLCLLALMLPMLLPHQLVLQLLHLCVHVPYLLLVFLLGCKEVHSPLALLRFLDQLLQEGRVEVLSIVEAIRVGDRVDLWLLLGLRRHVHWQKHVVIRIHLRENEL